MLQCVAVCCRVVQCVAVCTSSTGWRRLIGCLKLQVIFRKRATNYRALLREMTYKDKASYGPSPPCSMCLCFEFGICVMLRVLCCVFKTLSEDFEDVCLLFSICVYVLSFVYVLCCVFCVVFSKRYLRTLRTYVACFVCVLYFVFFWCI